MRSVLLICICSIIITFCETKKERVAYDILLLILQITGIGSNTILNELSSSLSQGTCIFDIYMDLYVYEGGNIAWLIIFTGHLWYYPPISVLNP